MFAAPPVIETAVFARIPERLWIDQPSQSRTGTVLKAELPVPGRLLYPRM